MKRLLALVLILLMLIPAYAEVTDYTDFDDVILLTNSDETRYYFCLDGLFWQLYSADGTPLLDWKWDASVFEPSDADRYFSGFGSGDSAPVNLNPAAGEYMLIDRDGNFLLDAPFDSIWPAGDGFFWLEKDGKTAFADPQGNIVIEPVYDYIGAFSGGVATFRSESGGWGLIDRSGRILVEPAYATIYLTDDGSYCAEISGHKEFFTVENGEATAVSTVGHTYNIDAYKPFTGAKTPGIAGTPDLQLIDTLPRLDGATALFPVYAGVVEMTYPDDTRYQSTDEAAHPLITLSNTLGAYQRLIDGDCDLIFVARPSKAQLEAAEKAGVEFDPTVIAREAFVFFVNRDNPLDSITTEQIRGIYSGKITSWDDLGVSGIGDIVAYQRPENSGSQTALVNLMGDTPLMEAPVEVLSSGMDDIINVVEYRNYPNAIGYSFRFFLSEMMGSDVKLLAIDGVEPTVENIRSGAYPIISDIYAVRRKGDANPSIRMLLDWLVSDQGQELIANSGYVPIR